MNDKCLVAKIIVIFLMYSPTSQAELSWKNLTDSWGNARDSITNAGIVIEVVYTGDYYSNRSGGIKQGNAYLDNKDISFNMDGEKLVGLSGSTLFIYFLGNAGDSISELVGDMQGISNIDSPDTWKLYEAWYEQKLLHDQLSFLLGLYDLNSEFDVMETSGLFINSSHGIGSDYSQSGVNGPSIFPTTSFAFRTRATIADDYYFQFSVFDGVPGDPDKDKGTYVLFETGDGQLLAVEGGYVVGTEENSKKNYLKLAIGGWYYTKALEEDALGNMISETNNNGIYILAEANVLSEGRNKTQGLSIFVRYGIANAQLNQIQNYTGAGIVYTGLIPTRNEDQLGLAVAHAKNSQDFIDATGADNSETIWELTYRAQFFPWLAIQPDFQYVINPGTDSLLDNATVVGIRTEIVF